MIGALRLNHLINCIMNCIEVLLVSLKFAVVDVLRIELLLQSNQLLWFVVLYIRCRMLVLTQIICFYDLVALIGLTLHHD